MPRTTRRERLFWQTVETQMLRLKRRLLGEGHRMTDPYRGAIGDYSYTVEKNLGSDGRRWGMRRDFSIRFFPAACAFMLSSAERASGAILEKMRGGSDVGLSGYAEHMEAGFQVFRGVCASFL